MAPSVCRTVALCSLLLVIGRVPLGIAQQGVGGVRGWSVAEALGRSTARLEKVNSRLTNTRAHSPDSDSNSTDRAGPGRVLQGEERREDAVLPLSRLSVPSLNKTSTNTTLSSLLPAVGSLLSSRSEHVSGPDKEKEGQRRLRGPHKTPHHKRPKQVLRLRARSEQSSRSGTEVLYDGAKHDSLVTHTQHQEANTITQALTSHPRSLQALPSLWPEQQQDSVAADRLVALSQRLNLSESQRDELRGWVKETALELLRQANPNPSPALSLLPPRHMQAQDKASTTGPSLLSSRDPLLSSPLIDALRSGHLASPPSPPRLLEDKDKEAEKDLLLPSERLGLSGQDLSSVRAALRESAVSLIKQAVTTSLGTRGQPTNNTHNTSQEGVGSGVEEARQQVTRPDGGSLLNPLTPLHKLPPPHRSLPSSPAPPLLPRNADPSRPPLGSRLNLTDSERSQLRQAVRDVAIGLLKEARTGEPDKQRSPALALLLPTEPQDERTALIDAIRDVAKARLTQPSTNTALSTSSSASGAPSSSSDDLLFHTNRHASPPHRVLPVTLGLQPGTVNTPQDQPQPQGSLAARVSSLSDGEKAELREAVKAAALALLREAAAREFGIATMAKAATAVATTGGF